MNVLHWEKYRPGTWGSGGVSDRVNLYIATHNGIRISAHQSYKAPRPDGDRGARWGWCAWATTAPHIQPRVTSERYYRLTRKGAAWRAYHAVEQQSARGEMLDTISPPSL